MILPHIGSTCRFVLTSKFSTLNGVYNVVALGSFNDLAASGVDFVTNLYKPVGLSQVDYANDFKSYQNTNVVMVTSVSDESEMYYFPEGILDKVPDPTVKKYQQYYFGISIGPYKDVNTLQSLATQLGSIVTDTTGVENPVRVFAASPEYDVWLDDSQYEALQQQRQANIKNIDTLYTQLQNSLALNSQLQSQLEALQQLIIQNGIGSTKS